MLRVSSACYRTCVPSMVEASRPASCHWWSLLKTKRLLLCLSLSARRSRHPTRPAYLREPTHQWHRTRAAVLQVRCPQPRRAHEGPSDPSPFLQIVAEPARRVASPCTSSNRYTKILGPL